MVWQLDHHRRLNEQFGNQLIMGSVTAIEHGWVKTFVFLPRKTVSNRWVWLKKVYMRRVWVYTGFVDEPFTQYGDILDVLRYP